MNFRDALAGAVQDHRHAKQEVALAESQRNDLIRIVYQEGGWSASDIAKVADLTPQRVAEIIASSGERRPTLHEAMQRVLNEAEEDWLPVAEVARSVYERELYRRRDRAVIPPGQIRARAAKYPGLFEGSTDGSNRIRLAR
jgi:hypothetical protein